MYNALVIGCGNIGALYDLNSEAVLTHAKAFSRDKRFRLAVFDRDTALARKIAAVYDCEVVDQINRQVLSAYQCVSICTPTPTHVAYLEECVKAGVELVICEKPVAEKTEDLQRIQKMGSAGKILVNYIRRFQPSFRALRDVVAAILVNEPLTNIAIRYQKGFINNCSHAFDTIQYLVGSEIRLNQVKCHHVVSDYFLNDPTFSAQALWNQVNVSIQGLTGLQFAQFEIDIYFTKHKICIHNSGRIIEVLEAKSDQGTLEYAKEQEQFTGRDCIENYMVHVVDHAHQLLTNKVTEDNFHESVNLTMEMLSIQNQCNG